MQELKLGHTANRFMDSQNSFLAEEKNTNKRKLNNLQQIQPWLQQPEGNPFINYQSKQIKVKRDSPKVKRLSSLPLNYQWKSIQKVVQSRQSKILPVMDIGQLNSIKKTYSNPKFKIKIDSVLNSESESTKRSTKNDFLLPSVKRELIIERKIFLIKKSGNSSPTSSPVKSARIRSIISDTKF